MPTLRNWVGEGNGRTRGNNSPKKQPTQNQLDWAEGVKERKTEPLRERNMFLCK